MNMGTNRYAGSGMCREAQLQPCVPARTRYTLHKGSKGHIKGVRLINPRPRVLEVLMEDGGRYRDLAT